MRLSPEDRQRLEGKEQNALPSLKESCDLLSPSCGGKCRPLHFPLPSDTQQLCWFLP